MNQHENSVRTSGAESANPAWVSLARRLASIRGSMTQAEMAAVLGVAKNTYHRFERGLREIGADSIAALVRRGWNANWLLTGEGPERLESDGSPRQNNDLSQSQAMSQASVKIAAQLLQEALDDADAVLAPAQHGEALVLLAQLLEKGLPEADVRPLARQTVGMIGTGVKDGAAAARGR